MLSIRRGRRGYKRDKRGRRKKEGVKHPTSKELVRIINLCDRVMESKQLYLNEQLSIVKVAQEVGTNRSYLSSSINRYYNLSFSRYISKYRVAHAKELMEHGHFSSMEEVALASGFGSEKTFIRHFTAGEGVSPLRYYRAVEARKEFVEKH